MSVGSDTLATIDSLGGVVMKSLLAMIVAGAFALSGQAIADDAGMSKADAKKICQDQINTPKDSSAAAGSGGPLSTPDPH